MLPGLTSSPSTLDICHDSPTSSRVPRLLTSPTSPPLSPLGPGQGRPSPHVARCWAKVRALLPSSRKSFPTSQRAEKPPPPPARPCLIPLSLPGVCPLNHTPQTQDPPPPPPPPRPGRPPNTGPRQPVPGFCACMTHTRSCRTRTGSLREREARRPRGCLVGQGGTSTPPPCSPASLLFLPSTSPCVLEPFSNHVKPTREPFAGLLNSIPPTEVR